LRWGVAIGAVYWYNTSAVFAEGPQRKQFANVPIVYVWDTQEIFADESHSIVHTIQPPPQFSDADLPTVEAVIAQKRKEAEARSQKAATVESETVPKPETKALATEASSTAPAKEAETTTPAPEGTPEALEEEAAQQGAFNPETGEINWDCPCLGGMAHGPCGEEFKAAFSCFVYSTEEPKGMDCIDKFQYVLV
jgi:mitochondrial intermembrane space import and assembly protein 40